MKPLLREEWIGELALLEAFATAGESTLQEMGGDLVARADALWADIREENRNVTRGLSRYMELLLFTTHAPLLRGPLGKPVRAWLEKRINRAQNDAHGIANGVGHRAANIYATLEMRCARYGNQTPVDARSVPDYFPF